ncbi:MAG: asparagine synthase (glutamine-hydrolyzing) [Patescibacteria group bacterium]
MCAINGFTGENSLSLIDKMNAATVHRGPDGTKTFLKNGITLGHNRLAILDPRARADQPMTDVSGRYTIVFNGEIYNFKELKKRFPYPYTTTSDTEVILAGYAHLGKKIFKELNGIFGLALWDKETQTLLLARDGVGVKPLYYTQHKNRFIFSSELLGIYEHDIPRHFSLSALNIYLRLLYVPGPDTFVHNVFQVPPGHIITISKNGSPVLEKFIQETRSEYSTRITFKEACVATRKHVTDAVERQLISDKPLGLFLSGGVDSSIILAVASQIRGPLDTFSIDFSGLGDTKGQERFNADALLATQTARRFGARHQTVTLPIEETGNLLEGVIAHLGTPISSPTELSQFALSRVAKKKVDVVLTGDGGDEIFGGYRRYQLALLGDLFDRVAPLRSILSKIPQTKKIADAPNAERIARFMFVKENFLQPLVTFPLSLSQSLSCVDGLLADAKNVPFTQKMLWFDRDSWLVDHSLVRTDAMTMAHGLEARVPLLDQEIVRFVEPLPLSYKVTHNASKRLLRAAFRDELSHLGLQPKRGWLSPGTKWLRRGPIHEIAREALTENFYDGTSSLFDWGEVESLFEGHREGGRYALTELWALLTFQLWAKRFKMKPHVD